MTLRGAMLPFLGAVLLQLHPAAGKSLGDVPTPVGLVLLEEVPEKPLPLGAVMGAGEGEVADDGSRVSRQYGFGGFGGFGGGYGGGYGGGFGGGYGFPDHHHHHGHGGDFGQGGYGGGYGHGGFDGGYGHGGYGGGYGHGGYDGGYGHGHHHHHHGYGRGFPEYGAEPFLRAEGALHYPSHRPYSGPQVEPLPPVIVGPSGPVPFALPYSPPHVAVAEQTVPERSEDQENKDSAAKEKKDCVCNKKSEKKE